MKFSELEFKPHRHAERYPGKTHARATLSNGATISVVYTPSEPLGPNDEPYEVQTSILDGPDEDGIFHCMDSDAVQKVIDESEAVR